jgi:hypothetical protein
VRVIVGCECSGVVREAFRKKGHDAWSCDIKPCEDNSPYHIQGDILDVLGQNWDLGIFHPPCTHLCVSGAAWFAKKRLDGRQDEGIDFFMKFTKTKIKHVCIENPIGIMSRLFRKPDQIIQPYWFGHTESKATCLWLWNLPRLKPTKICIPEMVEYASGKKMPKWYAETWRLNKEERATVRSTTFQGVADAFAEQWNDLQNYPSQEELFSVMQ